jgi:hypothetical protein
MKHFSGYGAYLLFLALRTHFTKAKYDFFQMHGKLRANKESYLKRRDKSFFERLARTYNVEELKTFYIANFLADRHYITEMLDEDAHGAFYELQKRNQSLSYIFKNDLDIIFENGCKSAFDTFNGDYPHIINLVMRRAIAIESAAILNDFVPYVDKFNKYLGDDDIVWSRVALKLRKYRPFIHYDAEKFKAILKEKVNENSTGRSI